MPVIKFDPNLSNFIVDGNERFFTITLDNRSFVVRDNCPHRGGPIHLGQFDCQKNTIICPWHGLTVSTTSLQQLAIPVVWRYDVALAVIVEAEGKSESITLQNRHIMVMLEHPL